MNIEGGEIFPGKVFVSCTIVFSLVVWSQWRQKSFVGYFVKLILAISYLSIISGHNIR